MIDRLIEFLISIVDLFRFWIVVDQDEAGVLLRLGAYRKDLEGGRFYWKIPLKVDVERLIKVVPDTYNLSPQALTTRDAKQIVVALIVKYRIKDVKKALLEVQDRDGVIRDSALAEVATLVQANDWAVVRSPEFSDTMTKASRKPAFPYGVEILSVKFTDCTTTFNLTQMQIGAG